MGDFIPLVLIVGIAGLIGMTADVARDAAGRDWLRRRWWIVGWIALAFVGDLLDRLVAAYSNF
jgi:hypothetical protein